MSRRLLHLYRLYGSLSRQRIQIAHGMQVHCGLVFHVLFYTDNASYRAARSSRLQGSAQDWFAAQYQLLPDWMLSLVVSEYRCCFCYPIGLANEKLLS